jgi:hypothetical protein
MLYDTGQNQIWCFSGLVLATTKKLCCAPIPAIFVSYPNPKLKSFQKEHHTIYILGLNCGLDMTNLYFFSGSFCLHCLLPHIQNPPYLLLISSDNPSSESIKQNIFS